MRRITRWGIAGALGALLMMPKAAHAYPSGEYWGGSLFQTGFDVTMSLDGNTLTLVIKNIGDEFGNYAGVFEAIGLVNVPATTTVTWADPVPAGWAFNTSSALGGDGLPPTIWAYYAGAPAPQNGLDLGESATFKFTLGGTGDWENIGVAVHAISGPGGCSTKYGVWNGGEATNDVGPDGYDPDCVSVPEPGTNALLAIGVLGLGFVATRRRSLKELLGQA